MDVSELLNGPRARAKDAEALAILTACAHPARQVLDRAKREYGTVLDVSQMGVFIDSTAEAMYKTGKRDSTRLLFDAYATIVFYEVVDVESFVAALDPIRARVQTTLSVIDAHEAELCRLEWVKRAWERGTPTALRRAWTKLCALLNPRTLTRGVRAASANEASPSHGATEWAATEDGPYEEPIASIASDTKTETNAELDSGARVQASRLGPSLAASLKADLHDWSQVEIRFLSDLRVQVSLGAHSETRNYAELGFEDGRSKLPNLAWLMLRTLATAGGVVPRAADGQDWTAVEKRMQELRKVFWHHFQLSADPLPFVEGIGYQARFKISCAPSYNF
jgi:hypothetical protein